MSYNKSFSNPRNQASANLMTLAMRALFCLSLACCAMAQEAQAQEAQNAATELTYEYDAGPQPQCDLEVAKFALWTGVTDGKINGIFIVLPGRNSDGRISKKKKEYQDLANKWGFALMTCYLRSKVDKDVYQLDMQGNTARLLNKALTEFSKIAKKPELDIAPVFCFGTSAGGNVASQFPNVFPKRTIGIVSFIPTIGSGTGTKEKKSVPMLIATGAKENAAWVNQIERNWTSGSPGAVWTLAKHKDLGHDGGPAFGLGMAWAEAVLSQRLKLDKEGKVIGLNPLPIHMGWVGDLQTYQIGKFAGKVTPLETWLPDEVTANAWNKYLTTSFGKEAEE